MFQFLGLSTSKVDKAEKMYRIAIKYRILTILCKKKDLIGRSTC